MKQEFGSLLHLYLEDIEIDNAIEKSEFLIAGAAKAINDAGGYNCIPVIVEQIDRNKYKVVANSFIYAAAEMAQIDRVWCIVVDDSEKTKQCAKIIAQESLPKIDLANATFEEIRMGLDYLINRPENKLSEVKLAIASNRIAEAEKQSWKSSLIDVTKLKCGITKGKKLNIFKEIFYLESTSVEEQNPDTEDKTDIPLLEKLTVKELRKLAQERKISGYSKMKKADLIKVLSD